MILVDLIFFLFGAVRACGLLLLGFPSEGGRAWGTCADGNRIAGADRRPVGNLHRQRTIPVSASVGFVLQLVVFGSAAAVLYVSGRHKLATLFLLVAIVELVLSHALNRQKAARL